MSTITTAKTELEHYSLLRFFHQSNKHSTILYFKDKSLSFAKKRSWGSTIEREQAYRFENRADARRAANLGACWVNLDEGYKWEVVEIQEVRVTTCSFIENVVASNASPIIQLARQAE